MPRFVSAVKRNAKGRMPWAVTAVTLWHHRLPPSLQLLRSGEKPVTLFKDAVERARSHEATRLTGEASVSAMSITPVRNRPAVRLLQSRLLRSLRRQQNEQ